MTVIAKMNFHYAGKTYPFEMEFDTPDAVDYMFDGGNYGCDCNRSGFIQEQDPDFPDLECGETIKMTNFWIEPK
jgi:hypothetical protein